MHFNHLRKFGLQLLRYLFLASLDEYNYYSFLKLIVICEIIHLVAHLNNQNVPQIILLLTYFLFGLNSVGFGIQMFTFGLSQCPA